MPPRLTPADLIARLRGEGYKVKEIAEIVGRSPRMVGKVQSGQSAPAGWDQALRKAWTNVANRKRHGRKRASVEDLRKVVPEPPRRQQATGKPARLRRGVWTQGRGWATGTIGAQAARSGGLALLPGVELAARRMWQLSATITFRDRRRPRPGAPRRGPKWYAPKHAPGAAGKAKRRRAWHAGSRLVPRDVLETYAGRGDEHLTLTLLDMMRQEGTIDYTVEQTALHDVESVEIRVWQA